MIIMLLVVKVRRIVIDVSNIIYSIYTVSFKDTEQMHHTIVYIQTDGDTLVVESPKEVSAEKELTL